MDNKTRPKHLNLVKVRMPVTAIVSILHRLSGALLFLSSPVLIYILTISLKNNSGFAEARQIIESPLAKLLMIILIWSTVHHFFAGIRYFVLDLDTGLDKKTANITAAVATLLGVLVSVFLVIGVFI